MHIVKAFEQYCLDENHAPLSGVEETTLDAFVVWLVQNELLSTLETNCDEAANPT